MIRSAHFHNRVMALTLASVVITSAFVVQIPASAAAPGLRGRAGEIFLLAASPSGDEVVKVDASTLRVLGRARLRGENSEARLMPAKGPIVAMTAVPAGAFRLRLVDPDTLAVTDVGPLTDITAVSWPRDFRLLTARAAPSWVGIVRVRFLGTAFQRTALLRNLRTGEQRLVNLHPDTELAALTILPRTGTLAIVLVTSRHEVFVVDVASNTLSRITARPLSPSPVTVGSAGPDIWPVRGFLVTRTPFNSNAIDGAGTRFTIDLRSGQVQSTKLAIDGIGDRVSVSKVIAGRRASPAFAVGIVGEDPSGWIGSIVLFDRRWSVVGRLSGLSAFDFAFHPTRRELVVLSSDGSLARYAVPGGRRIVEARGLLPQSSTIVGIR